MWKQKDHDTEGVAPPVSDFGRSVIHITSMYSKWIGTLCRHLFLSAQLNQGNMVHLQRARISLRSWAIQLGSACFLGLLLYHVPAVFLEIVFFPAHGAMTPNGIPDVTIKPADLQHELTKFPKIVHVTYKSKEELPPAWENSMNEWKRFHPDWEVRFWSDEDIDSFVRMNFPDFYENTFQKYPYAIQKVDAVRYLILWKLGGVYSDLDIYPAQNLESLFAAVERDNKNVLLAKTLNLGVTNAFMAAVPESDFMQCVIDHLPEYQTKWFHYATFGWRHWRILSSAGSAYLWGMLGHCGTGDELVLSTESFRKCSVCDAWGEPMPDHWCDTDWLKHTSTNSSWHQAGSTFHDVWFFFVMSLMCKPLRACILFSVAASAILQKFLGRQRRQRQSPGLPLSKVW